MPTDQPNNAPDLDTNGDARDPDSAAALLSDEQMDDAAGGGGLGGAVAADPLGGSARTPGGASPNAPIDTEVDAGDAGAGAEARVRATQTGVSETQSTHR